MRSWHVDTTNHLQAREDTKPRVLMWIEARNRSTGAVETTGLWTGDDARDFVIDGVTRTYYGAGEVVGTEPLVFTSGLQVRQQTIILSPLTPAAQDSLRLYDSRFAPVELHAVFFKPGTDVILGNPERVFKGWIDKIGIHTPEIGGDAEAEVLLASVSRRLTRTLHNMKSNETMQHREPGDDFRQHADVSGSVQTVWGEERATNPE